MCCRGMHAFGVGARSDTCLCHTLLLCHVATCCVHPACLAHSCVLAYGPQHAMQATQLLLRPAHACLSGHHFVDHVARLQAGARGRQEVHKVG